MEHNPLQADAVSKHTGRQFSQASGNLRLQKPFAAVKSQASHICQALREHGLLKPHAARKCAFPNLA